MRRQFPRTAPANASTDSLVRHTERHHQLRGQCVHRQDIACGPPSRPCIPGAGGGNRSGRSLCPPAVRPSNRAPPRPTAAWTIAASSPAARSVEASAESNPLVNRSIRPNSPSSAISVRRFFFHIINFFTKITDSLLFPKNLAYFCPVKSQIRLLHMINIVLFGAPGCGKRHAGNNGSKHTTASSMSRRARFIRDEIRRGTELGRSMESYIKAGKLAPDEIVIGMVANYVSEHKHVKGCIFDGFPAPRYRPRSSTSSLPGTGSRSTSWSTSTSPKRSSSSASCSAARIRDAPTTPPRR